jgi:hypothetical protein
MHFIGNIVAVVGRRDAATWDLVLAGHWGGDATRMAIRIPAHRDWWYTLSMPVTLESLHGSVLLTVCGEMRNKACFSVTSEGDVVAYQAWLFFSLGVLKPVRKQIVAAAIRQHGRVTAVVVLRLAQLLGWRRALDPGTAEQYRANFRRWYFSANIT